MLLQRSAASGVAATAGTFQQQSKSVPCMRCSSVSLRASNLASSSFRTQQRLVLSSRTGAVSGRTAVVVRAGAEHNPPPVSDTKAAFLKAYPRPLPGLYDTIIQELLVVQHLIRFQKRYQYSSVAALGFVSVFDQIMEGLPASDQTAVLKAFIEALQEDPEQYRRDAKSLEEWARATSSEDLKPVGGGTEGQQALASLAERSAAGTVLYSKFLAIGLFRILELVGAKDPKALESLVKSVNLRPELINRDLLSYKGVLSKLSASKELMKEIIAREEKKQAEREADKAKRAEGKVAVPADVSA